MKPKLDDAGGEVGGEFNTIIMGVDVKEENMRLARKDGGVRVVRGDCAFPNALYSRLVVCTCGVEMDGARGGMLDLLCCGKNPATVVGWILA